MRDDSVVKGYAASLFGVARSEDLVEVVEDELYRLKEVLQGNAELREFLSNLRIAPEGKKKALQEIFDIWGEGLWDIGVVGEVPRIGITNINLKNAKNFLYTECSSVGNGTFNRLYQAFWKK